MVQQFRKKPVVIEAVQFTGTNGHELIDFADSKRVTCPGQVHIGLEHNRDYETVDVFYVDTLEGQMIGSVGDWLICGVKNELYPCKPDVFEATYEPCRMKAVVIPHAYEEHTKITLATGKRENLGYCHHCHAPENMVWHLPGAEIVHDGYRFPFQEIHSVDNKRVEPAKPGDDCRAQVARNEPWCQHRQEFAIIIYSSGLQRWQELYVCGPCHETLLTFPHVRTSWPLWTDVEEHRAKLFPATKE